VQLIELLPGFYVSEPVRPNFEERFMMISVCDFYDIVVNIVTISMGMLMMQRLLISLPFLKYLML